MTFDGQAAFDFNAEVWLVCLVFSGRPLTKLSITLQRAVMDDKI